MLLLINRATMTAVAHHHECETLTAPPYTPEQPFCRMGPLGGWFPIADKAHAGDKVAQYLPGARLLGCRTCVEGKRLRVILPSNPEQEDWDVE